MKQSITLWQFYLNINTQYTDKIKLLFLNLLFFNFNTFVSSLRTKFMVILNFESIIKETDKLCYILLNYKLK